MRRRLQQSGTTGEPARRFTWVNGVRRQAWRAAFKRCLRVVDTSTVRIRLQWAAPFVATVAVAACCAAPAMAADPPASTLIQVTSPSEATYTRQYVTVGIHVEAGVHDTRLEFRTSEDHVWSPVPLARLATPDGVPLTSEPLATDADGNASVRWDMPATTSDYPGVAPENSIGSQDSVIFMRAAAIGPQGEPLVSEPGAVALVRSAPLEVHPEAETIKDGWVLFGGPPIHVAWEESHGSVPYLGHGAISVPVAGYAVDVVPQDAPLPAPVVTTTETSYDVPVPPVSDVPYVIVVRPIDAAGNVVSGDVVFGDVGARQTDPFVSADVVLTQPPNGGTVADERPVLLRAPSSEPTTVCFQYRALDLTRADGEVSSWRAIPASEVTTAAGKGIRRWPVVTSRTAGTLRWKGLSHAYSVDGLPGRAVDVRVARMRAPGSCAAAPGTGETRFVSWTLTQIAYDLDPASPDPRDRFWGTDYFLEEGREGGSGGSNGPMYYAASVTSCSGCRASTTDRAFQDGSGPLRKSPQITEMRLSNNGKTTATITGCAGTIEISGQYKGTIRVAGRIVGAHGVGANGTDGAFELTPLGRRIAFVVARSCSSQGGAIRIRKLDANIARGRDVRACESACSYPAFPDGLHLSWIDAEHDLRIATVAALEERGTKAQSAVIRHGVRAATWSHDGKIVAIDDGTSRTIVLYSRTGAAGFARAHRRSPRRTCRSPTRTSRGRSHRLRPHAGHPLRRQAPRSSGTRDPEPAQRSGEDPPGHLPAARSRREGTRDRLHQPSGEEGGSPRRGLDQRVPLEPRPREEQRDQACRDDEGDRGPEARFEAAATGRAAPESTVPARRPPALAM